MVSNPEGGFEFNRPTIISLLYLLGALTGGLATVVGVVLAYVWRGEVHEPWEGTHYTFLIRTFWIGLLAALVGVCLMIIGIGFLILFLIPVWIIVRSVISLLNAQKRAPMADPQSFLF